MTTMHKTLKRLVTAIAATAALALIPLAALASPASASAGQDHLSTNEVLQAGQYIRSSNGYWAVVQSDGNFVLYNAANRPLWASNTVGTGAHNWLAMQSDGNLVLYNQANRPVWANNRNGSGTANWLAVQTDGNLVEYTSANHPVWATNTVQASGGTSSTTPALGTWWGTAGPLHAYQALGYPYPYASQCTAGGACQVDQWNFYKGQCTSWVPTGSMSWCPASASATPTAASTGALLPTGAMQRSASGSTTAPRRAALWPGTPAAMSPTSSR